MAWEDPALSFGRRLGATLAASFAPLESLQAVARGETRPALRFALLTALPFMMLWAIFPYTYTILFSSPFGVELLPDKSTVPVWLDVLRAMGIGLGLELLSLLSWSIPFVSLVRAFANGSREEDPTRAAWRTTLYRVWVIPFGIFVFWLLHWGLPEESGMFVREISWLGMHQLPRILILIHCHAMARYFGADGMGAFAVSVVPLAVEWAIGLTVERGARLLLPVAMQGG